MSRQPARVGRPVIGPKIGVRVPVDLLALLDRYADQLGISRAGTIRLLLWRQLDPDMHHTDRAVFRE